MLLQPVNGALGTIGLSEIDGDAEYNDDEDDFRLDLLSQKGGNYAGDQKDDNQRIQKKVQQFRRESRAPRGSGIVGAVG